MFEREALKLKSLTEKLDAQGDVTEDEADWIYMFRIVFLMTCAKHKSLTHVPHTICNMLEDNFVGSYPYVSAPNNQVSETFFDWYDAVYRHVRNGMTGNCLSTVPCLMNISINSPAEKNINDVIHKIACELPNRDKWSVRAEDKEADAILPFISKKRILANDICYCRYGLMMQRLDMSRYGLLNRLSKGEDGDTKDVNYLRSMAGKLKSGNDITEDEADNIYLILKFAQAAYVNWKSDCLGYDRHDEEKQKVKKEQVNSLMNGLLTWFKAVYEAVKQGRTGNFTYTLPMNLNYNIGKAKTYVRKALEILPPDYTILHSIREITGIEGTPIDSYVINNTIGMTIRSYRYGAIKRSGIDLSECVMIPDPETASSWWESAVTNDSYSDLCINKNNGKCHAIVAKLEYLRRCGVLPAGTFINSHSYFVAFRKKDYEEYRHVLEAPDEEIEELAPKARSHFKEDIFAAIEGAINVVNMLSSIRKGKEEYLEEDEWMEIDR